MGLIPWQATVQDDAGNAVPSPTITVRNASDDSLADIFDLAGSPIATNPFDGTTEGFVQFQVYPGRYKIEGAKDASTAQTWYLDASDGVFTTRAEAVSAVSAGWVPVTGREYTIAGLSYVGLIGATDIADLNGLVPNGDIYPDHFAVNTTPGATDMTSAFQAAIDYVTQYFDGIVGGAFPRGLQAPAINLLPAEYIVTDTLTTPVTRNYWRIQAPTAGQSCITWQATGTAKPFIDLGSGGSNFQFVNVRTYVDPDSYTRPSVWFKTTATLDHDFRLDGSYIWEAEEAIIECGGITNLNLVKFRVEGTNGTILKINDNGDSDVHNRLIRLQNWTIHARTSGLTMSSLVDITSSASADQYTVQFDGQRIELDSDSVDATNFDFVKVHGTAAANPLVNVVVANGGYQDNGGTYAGAVSIVFSDTGSDCGVSVSVENFRFDRLDNVARGAIIDVSDAPAGSTLADKISRFAWASSTANLNNTYYGFAIEDSTIGDAVPAAGYFTALWSEADDTSTTPLVEIRQSGTGDAGVLFRLVGGQTYHVGIDNSDSDALVIGRGTTIGTNASLKITSDGVVHILSRLDLNTYTVATLPSAGDPGCQVYVSDESGGAVVAFSDGTNWRRVTDRAVVS